MLPTLIKVPADWYVVEPKPEHLAGREHAVTNGLAMRCAVTGQCVQVWTEKGYVFAFEDESDAWWFKFKCFRDRPASS